jgi:DNA-binding transcriptional LysR family regulator
MGCAVAPARAIGDRLERLLGEFVRRAPDVQLELVNAPTEQRLRQVRSGELDATLVRGEWAHPELDFTTLWEDRVFVALPLTHPLAKRDVIGFAEPADLPVRLSARSRYPTQYDLVVASCRASS